jgi:CBS domain-containing protein
MKVKEVMTPIVQVCIPTDTLATAAGHMWDHDCGVLPVVKDGKVVGLITDRDICMAAAMNNHTLSNLAVEDVINGKVYSVGPEYDVLKALEVMAERKIRRLPVVSEDGALKGILSMNDVVLKAEEAKDKKHAGIAHADIVKTYKAICEHPAPFKEVGAAAGGV